MSFAGWCYHFETETLNVNECKIIKLKNKSFRRGFLAIVKYSYQNVNLFMSGEKSGQSDICFMIPTCLGRESSSRLVGECPEGPWHLFSSGLQGSWLQEPLSFIERVGGDVFSPMSAVGGFFGGGWVSCLLPLSITCLPPNPLGSSKALSPNSNTCATIPCTISLCFKTLYCLLSSWLDLDWQQTGNEVKGSWMYDSTV